MIYLIIAILTLPLFPFFFTVYLFTRFDIGKYWDDEDRTALVVVISLFWPVAVPITLLVFACMFLGELAVSAGEAAKRKR